MGKVNFTAEHKTKLDTLSLEALTKGTQFKGKMGTNLTIYDLYHNSTINTVSALHTSTKKEIADIETMDEWSLTDYQQRKKLELTKKLELLSLIVGYKRKQEEIDADKEKLKNMKALYSELKESTKTPAEKLQELESQMAAMVADGVEV